MASITDSFARVLRPLSTDALRLLHDETRRLLAEDDSLPTYADKRYGVRKFPEFKAQADVIERILSNRNETFDPIPW